MNNTITLSTLITRLAKVADTDTNTSRRFLRSFFGAIEKELADGESVTVKGIGTFRRSTDATFGTPGAVQFIPDSQFTAEINAPFDMFEAVEVADGVVFDDEKPEDTPEPEPVAETATAPEPAPEPEPAAEPEPTANPEPVAEPEPPVRQVRKPVSELRWPEEEEEEEEKAPARPAEPKPVRKPNPRSVPAPDEPEDDEDEVEEEYEDDAQEEEEERRGFPWWFWLGIAVMLIGGCALGYYAAIYEPTDEVEDPAALTDSIASAIEEVQVAELNAEMEAAEAEDKAIPDAPDAAPASKAEPAPETEPAPKAEPAKPAAPAKAEPVYDTVTQSLAKLAKKHYGNTNYWVFIYQANESKLGNPDHINAGTRVLIPARESFEEATTEATKAKAKALNTRIINKYKR